MVRLYPFFTDECQQKPADAEVRVGLIRNALWTLTGVPPVRIYERYETTGEGTGCDPVRKAVTKWQKSQGKNP